MKQNALTNCTIEFNSSDKELTFIVTVGYGHCRSFNSYYGSMPVYDDEYEGETDYEYKLTFDDFLEEFNIYDLLDESFASKYPELYSHFYDQDDDWVGDDATEEDVDQLLTIFADKINEELPEKAQNDHDNQDYDYPY